MMLRPAHILNCLLFVAALALGSALIYPLFPGPKFLRSELDYFAEHKDEYDLVFLGSSVIRRGIIPRQFDQRLGELGHEVKSFNLAIAGMRSHEINYFMDQVLALKPARLKWVIVELDRFNPFIHEENRMAPRMIFWHDLPQTLLALKSIQLEEGPILDQLQMLGTHGTLLGAKAISIGRGPDLLEELRGGWVAQREAELQEHQGWVGQTQDEAHGIGPSIVVENRRKLLEDPAWYASEVSALSASNRSASSHAGFNFQALAHRQVSADEAKVKLIHIISPQLDLLPDIHHALELGLIENTLDYHQPERFPELYAIENHFDRNHLNPSGAALWTRRLAEDLAPLLAEH